MHVSWYLIYTCNQHIFVGWEFLPGAIKSNRYMFDNFLLYKVYQELATDQYPYFECGHISCLAESVFLV